MRGEKRIMRGATPYFPTTDNIEEQGGSRSNEPVTLSVKDTTEANLKEEPNASAINETAAQKAIIVKDEMDVSQDKVEAPDYEMNNLDSNNAQSIPINEDNVSQEKPKDKNPVPLDKFKRRLVRAVARKFQQKMSEEEMWEELKNEIGCDCKMLWQHMRALTLKKLKRLLPANDLLENLKKIARFTVTDWLLFDLILVHEKINVISINDSENAQDDNREEPTCLRDLFDLVKEHKVERSFGDDLIEAWIRVTLQYNSRGRQCSPMLLQLRWYQLKELTRARFYNFWCAYRGNQKILDRAMKFKPTALQADIAREYKNIITDIYPEWEKLIEERRVILTAEFTLNREAKRKVGKGREENDEEIKVIEPLVETIELEVDSDEEKIKNSEESSDKNISNVTEDINKKFSPNSDENNVQLENTLDNVSNVKSESDDDVLDLDGLSDVETMHIPLEKVEKEPESLSEISIIIKSKTDVNELLPKITNVVGNIIEQNECTDEQNLNTVIEKNGIILDDAITETKIDFNKCTEPKGTKTMQCDSDDEINEILRVKANSLMNIEITQIKSECEPNNQISSTERPKVDTNPIEKLHVEKEQFNSVSDLLCSGSKLILNDSDDDMDKIIQENAYNYISIKMPQPKVQIIAESLDDMNTHANYESDVKYEIIKGDTVKKEKNDDAFDEIEFDDDQIEFVDDGIEFVDELEGYKSKQKDMKRENLSDSKDETTPKIDLKLLMNPTVYTKKLDLMEVFKFTDYNSVSDKNAIECAIFESKPVDKLALKDEDINKFREQAMYGIETDGTQSDSDTVQSDVEYANNRIKCTSWLLQKPKNRSYNPIQLCKNPDFNTRLQRLTAGFLSSSRNRVLLTECKPLTIDLHKAFEKKLINGTMYLKSGDFKSAKSTEMHKINSEPVSVLPSVIPGQSMIFTTGDTNNTSAAVPNKLGNQEDSLPVSSILEKSTPSERTKVIRLPDIDQIRRVNQSLLTAEVTPIRIDNKIDNTNSCKESVKTSFTESVFVQPIVFTPLAEIKKEPSELEVADKNKCHPQSSSRKDLIASKINDQIINLSNQISEVDNNELLSVDIEKTAQNQPKIKNKLRKKAKNYINKTKSAQPVNKLTYMPCYKGKLTWAPKYPKNHIADSLLTLDTLSKILFLLNGNEEDIENSTNKQKKVLKTHYAQHQYSQMKQSISETEPNKVQSALTKCKNIFKNVSPKLVIQSRTKNSIQRGALRKRGTRTRNKPRNPPEPKKYGGIYCCWAREKMISINANKPLETNKHGCQVYQCHCCCRQELVNLTIWKSSTPPHLKSSKKISSTIILSDDEDLNKTTQTNKETTFSSNAKSGNEISESCNLMNNSGMPNAITDLSDKVTIEILIPPQTSNINTNITTNCVNVDVKNISLQSEVPPENILINASKLQQLSDTETDALKNLKSCKTVVHAAGGHAYNKRVESVSSNSKGKNISMALNPSIPISNISNEISPKKNERTLFLNSSQILNKPTKTPIFLGKNKILLCSLKNPSIAPPQPANPYVPILPFGVHFVMLPHGELTLSIDNSAQLDSEQLSTLPALMSMVQEQFMKSSISNIIPEHNTIPQENDNIGIKEKSNITKQTNSVKDLDIPLKIQDKSTQSDNLVTNVKGVVSDSKNVTESSSSNLNVDGVSLSLNSGSVTSTQTTQSEMVNTQSIHKKSVEENQLIENQILGPKLVAETQTNVSQTPECLPPSAEPCVNDNNDICENKQMNTRKTILSDLMEMSGISAEDTSMVPDVINPCPSITTLPPTIIPVTKRSGSGTDMLNPPTNPNVPGNISIAGPYSNLLTFEPTTPINHLLNCIAQMRPELNAVTSFAELKYVYTNDGRFYKLDVDSGIITEIKVFIKKNPKSQISAIPKAFVDLTDDTDGENVTCAEFQDIPQDKQGNAEVKPIKLFKAVHPAILKRSARSLLKENEVAYPKKAIRIGKQKRKQLLNVGNKYILVDVKTKNDPKEPEVPPASHLDSSYDSSDDEPLAKKCKRIKSTEQNVEATMPLFRDLPESSGSSDSVPEETPGIVDISGECDDTSDIEMNTMDIQGVNPELHPVAFEEGSESDEDMCILGV